MQLLNDLRQRPEEERVAVAAISAGVVVLVLFLAWGILFFRSDRSIVQVDVGNQPASAGAGLERVRDDIANTAEDFSERYEEFQRQLQLTGSTQHTKDSEYSVQLSTDENGDIVVDTVTTQGGGRDTLTDQ